MTELNRTLVFVVAAVVTAGAAIATNYRPAATTAAIKERREGEQFYPEFVDPNAATSLKVAAYSEADAKLKQFSVEFKDKLWVIPSHNNYPADGKTRLAETAASIVGIKRDEWHGNREEDYATLGVVDPLSPTATKGRGQRITLSKGSDILADYIIGKQVKSRNGFYYVRRPDEKSVYVAKLNVNLSTKFSDWVETDLLLLDQNDVTSVLVDNYKIENDAITPGEKVELSRAKPSDKWKLDGLDVAKEQLDEAKVSSMLGTLDSLTLVGVRAKPAGLSKSLKANDGGIKLTESTLIDLQRKGYFFTRNSELFSRNGEISVTTNKGVRYALRLGDVVVGDESMIEIGIEADKAAEKTSEKDPASKTAGSDADAKDKDAAAADKAGEKTGDAAEPKPGEQTSRYVFVLAQFDPELLGPKPVPPEKPAAAKPDATEEKAAEGKSGDEKAAEGDAAKADDAAKSGEDGKSETAKAADAAAKAAADEVAYKTAMQRYEQDLKDYEKKVKDGEELVRKLNVRFADWYYVISADTLAKLRLQKTDLIKATGEKPAGAAGDGAGGIIDPFSGEEAAGAGTAVPAESPAGDGKSPDGKSPESTDPAAPEKDAAADGAEKQPATPDGTEPTGTEPSPSGNAPPGTDPVEPGTGEPGDALPPAGENPPATTPDGGSGAGEPAKNP